MIQHEDVAVCAAVGNRPEVLARARALSGVVAPRQPQSHTGQALSADELAVCAATGVDPADFATAKSAQIAQLAARNAGAVWIDGTSGGGVSPEEARICALTGVSAEQFIAARDRKE